ncbi:hypothetical protein NCS56_00179100 [Fusarium sp. Ph1]|nr:hypothetical protein NCS56_00179100 [Fusarium sp. Ph1]
MRFSAVSGLALATVAATGASAMSAKMETLRSVKQDQWAQMRDEGAFDEDQYRAMAVTKCVNGKAGEYSCNNVDMMAFLSHQDMGSRTRMGNDIWGWTSATGREFAIVGQSDGTAFAEIKSDGSIVYLGRLPTQTVNSDWRDMKVIGDHVYIGAEASRHGIQVFDLKKLLSINPSSPKTFSITSDLTAFFNGVGNSHNIVANPDTNMIYAVGTGSAANCRGGLYMIDVSNPAKPVNVGCESRDGYVHDAQCVVYDGVDTAFNGHEICFNYNEDSLTIVDVTDKAKPVQLSRVGYSWSAYTHQGWLATSDMRYLLLDDELDEMDGTTPDSKTKTYVWDVKDLRAPKMTGVYSAPVTTIDHNQYVLDGLSYQSNYASGLRILDVSSIAEDPTGSKFEQVGFFDCDPFDDNTSGSVTFRGAWSVYPYFKSGYIVLNSIERGLFSLKYTGPKP